MYYDMDDSDVAMRANIEDEWEEAQEFDYEQGTDTATELIGQAREDLAEEESDRIERQLERDPVGYFVDDVGIYSTEDLLQQSFINIDYEAAAQEAVRADGVAHFLAGYDGHENETDEGMYYYRQN